MRTLFHLGVEYKELPQHPRIWVSLYGFAVCTKPINGKGPEVAPRFLRAWIDPDGYPRINIQGRRSDGCIKMGLHVAVLTAWCRPRAAGEVARHLDGIRAHPWLANLAWGTIIENAADTRLHGRLKGTGNPAVKMTEADVIRLRQERQHKTTWRIVKENPQWSRFAIWAAITGYSWTHLPGAVSQGRRCSKKIRHPITTTQHPTERHMNNRS